MTGTVVPASAPRTGLTAEATARRVLEWALTTLRPRSSPGEAAVPVPAGQLRGAGSLARPAAETVKALAALTRFTAARLGAGAPPFGDAGPIGLGGVLLAAAIGGRHEAGAAALLAEALPPLRLLPGEPDGWADAMARHAVLAPFLASAPTPLTELLLAASPLSAVLHRPAANRLASTGSTRAEVDAAVGLLGRPRGRAVLAGLLSAHSVDPLVLGWRTELFTVLARTGTDAEFVADVYLAARLRHAAAWDAALPAARRAFRSRSAPDKISIATVRYWLPLANLHRDTDLVRQRPRLLAEARPALTLVETYRRALTAVMA